MFQFQLEQRVHCMDIKYPVLVAGLSSNKLLIIDINKMSQIQNRQIGKDFYTECSLESNISCVNVFPDQSAYCVGTYDGRANLTKLARDTQGTLKPAETIIGFKSQKYDSTLPNGQILVPVS